MYLYREGDEDKDCFLALTHPAFAHPSAPAPPSPAGPAAAATAAPPATPPAHDSAAELRERALAQLARYLAYISRIPPPYLAHISPISRLYLPSPGSRRSRARWPRPPPHTYPRRAVPTT